MKKYLQKITFLVLILLSLIAIYPNKVWANIKIDSDEITNLKHFVDSGLLQIKEVGPKKAFAEFSDPKGKFVHNDLYLFVYDYTGKCLAHGSTPNRVGKNFLDELDKYGTPVVKSAIDLAKIGGGFFSYYWESPETHAVQLKTAYIKAIDNHTLIGSGLYKNIDVTKSHLIRLKELKAFVNSGITYFKEHGAKEAYKEFDNPQGKFKRGDLFFYVYDYNGVCLAHGDIPSKIGKNLYDDKDEFGIPYVQLLIQAAKSNANLVSYYSKDPISKNIKLKTSYVKPLDDATFIGAGIYDN